MDKLTDKIDFPPDTDRWNPPLSSPNYKTHVTEGDKKKTRDR